MAVAGASGAAQVGAPLAGLRNPSRWGAIEGAAQGHPARRLLAQPELGLQPVGYVDADPPPPTGAAGA